VTEQALYKATVLAPHNRYRRSGVGFMQGENEVEVTAEQLEAIHADPLLKVMEAEEADMGSIQKEILVAFDTLVSDFIEARASEGANLKTMIDTRLEGVLEQAKIVSEHMPEVLKWQRERITSRLEEASAEIDPARLEQELIFLAQKTDVMEELDRLQSHVSETQKIMKKGGACGRRLDFMMQEFNRESNTLASKSINPEITNAAVELKVLIEQMREQIQNIE